MGVPIWSSGILFFLVGASAPSSWPPVWGANYTGEEDWKLSRFFFKKKKVNLRVGFLRLQLFLCALSFLNWWMVLLNKNKTSVIPVNRAN